jgi:hypothetical protein
MPDDRSGLFKNETWITVSRRVRVLLGQSRLVEREQLAPRAFGLSLVVDRSAAW